MHSISIQYTRDAWSRDPENILLGGTRPVGVEAKAPEAEFDTSVGRRVQEVENFYEWCRERHKNADAWRLH